MSGAVYVVRGAIDPLLGYLSSAINDEAQLLGHLHRDAQFIKDEMESMNGFLHHLAEAGEERERDHQVRAWMKQVRDLAYDTQYCIDLYGHRVGAAPTATGSGVWGHMRRGFFFLRTIPARHQVATQIREIKSRARHIGEGRLRYGVKVPAKDKQSNEVAQLESISINGITTGLPNWIQELPHLVEITLRKTSLADDSIRMLGQLVQLRCLTLRHDSYTENNLSFIADEFMNIQFLVIEGASNIKRINFDVGTAPKLEKIVWTFTKMDISEDTITGLSNLPSLKELELNGEFDPYHVEQAVALHPSCPIFRPKIILQDQPFSADSHDVSIME